MSHVAAAPGQNATMQNATTTGNGTPLSIPRGIKHHAFYVRGATGVTAGAITFETAADPDYTGDWAPLPSSTDPTPGKINPLTVVADDEEVYTYDGALAVVRARISTTISGGGAPSVTVTYRGH